MLDAATVSTESIQSYIQWTFLSSVAKISSDHIMIQQSRVNSNTRHEGNAVKFFAYQLATSRAPLMCYAAAYHNSVQVLRTLRRPTLISGTSKAQNKPNPWLQKYSWNLNQVLFQLNPPGSRQISYRLAKCLMKGHDGGNSAKIKKKSKRTEFQLRLQFQLEIIWTLNMEREKSIFLF